MSNRNCGMLNYLSNTDFLSLSKAESIFFELAQIGKTNEEGLPHFLQFAVIQDTYPDHAYLTNLPIGVQKTLFAPLAPLGRLLGYKASPSLEKSSDDII